MLRPPRYTISGHMLIEAIVGSTLVITISAGMWRLVSTTGAVATKASQYNEPPCEVPTCHDAAESIECRCGDNTFTILR